MRTPLANAERHQRREPVELSDLVAGCLDRVLLAAPDYRWHADITTGVVVVGDAELLRRAVDNLLANVLAHTPPETEAMLTLTRRPDAVTIEVRDDGPGVPAKLLPHIFDGCYRAGSGGPGSGPGLAVVNQAATVHNGTVRAGPNHPHGLRVTLTLPVAPDAQRRNVGP